jgi:festuclavine dehydrogenase
MTTLLLGGIKAKTSSRLAALLAQSNTPFLLASRSASSPESSPSPYPQAKFDWLDESTYVTPFDESVQKTGHEVSAVYLVAPPVTDMLPPMKAFIDLAVRDKKVQRVVLLSASSLEKGGVAMGKVHEYVEKLAGEVGFEYAVLRPTWFMGMLRSNRAYPTGP